MGHRVVVLDDLSGGARDNVPVGAEFVEASVTDDAQIDALFQSQRFDYVYHLAAYAAEGLSHFIRRFNYTNNVIGSVTLINAAINAGTVKRFVFTSSIAVYGPGQLPMTEALTPTPVDPYGIAKYTVEQDLRAARELFGLEYTIFRPHNVYGERQNIGDRYRNVIGIFMNQIMRGEPLTIFGDGEQTRAFTHVADVAPAIARSVERDVARDALFNIGADEPHSVNALVAAVGKAMGAVPEVTHLAQRHEVVHAYSDHASVRAAFGDLLHDVTLEDGLARMAAWARGHGATETPRFTAIEVARNLPPSWR